MQPRCPMAEFIALDRLLAQGRDRHTPFAVRHSVALDFGEFVQSAAGWRLAFSQRAGQRLALFSTDAAQLAAMLFGAWYAGKCVYLPADTLPGTLTRLRDVVDGFAGEFPVDCAPYAALPATQSELVWHVLPRDDELLVIYTSGSTGEPTAIIKRLAQLFDETAALAQAFDERLGDCRVVCTVSPQHIYGLLFGILWPLAAGRPIEARRLVYAEDMVSIMSQAGSYALVASPAHLKRLPTQLAWDTLRPQLRAVFSSGGPLPVEAWQDTQTLMGQCPIEIYGSSETGGIAWRERCAANDAWQPLPGVAVQIEAGHLRVRSPHLAIRDWFDTADRAESAGSNFQLLGRSDRIVKIEEKRVSLTGMEANLLESGLLAEVRILPMAGNRTLLGVVAVLNAAGMRQWHEQGRRTLNDTLRRHLSDRFEASVLPRRWRYEWCLPQNSQGKIPEEALLALFDPRRPHSHLLALSAGQATLQLAFPHNSPYFDGHFPGYPILAGVTQLEWIIRLGRELLALPPAFRRMEAIKFQQPIPPEQLVRLTLERHDGVGETALMFAVDSALGSHSKGRIALGAAI